MNSGRFIRGARHIFGTHILSMNPNTIKRLCKTTRFHHSVQKHTINAQYMNILTLQNTGIASLLATDCLLNQNCNELDLLLEKNDLQDTLMTQELDSIINSINCTLGQTLKGMRWSHPIKSSN